MTTYKIKERREKLKMSQAELSRRSGICRATLSLLENGAEIDVRVSTIDAISKALKCSPASLFCSKSPQE